MRPGQLTEAVGDADAVQATTLGLKNLERVAALLLDATNAPGDPYDDLDELYGRLVGQWATEMNHVAAVVVSESDESPVPLAETAETMARFLPGVEVAAVARNAGPAAVHAALGPMIDV